MKLLDFPRKLAALDCQDVYERVTADCEQTQWPADLWWLHVLGELHPAKTLCEIGTHKGGSLVWLCEWFKPQLAVCIDPHEGMSGPADALVDRLHENLAFLRDRHGMECQYVHDHAENVACEFEDELFDVVFVDGEHTTEAVTRDITHYWPKVASGGLLIGHDYYAKLHQSVIDAVDAWEQEPICSLLYPSRLFFAQKP